MLISSTNIKVVAALVTSAVLFAAGYWVGSSIVATQWKTDISERDSAAAIAMSKINESNNRLNTELTEAKAQSDKIKTIVRTETRDVEKEVIKYVKEYVERDVCRLDDEWVRIYNLSASRTQNVTTTTDHRDLSAIGENGKRRSINSFVVVEAKP